MSASKTSSGRFELARRLVLAAVAAGAVGAGVALHALPVSAQQAKGPSEVPVEELMKPVGLPDMALGPADAKVTIVEYASMTCGHCAHFTTDVWPQIKKKYVDSNKVRYIFREFPLDNLAAAASMLARCTGNDKAFPLIEVLFEKQKEWAFGEGNPVPRLFEIAKQVGFTQEFVRQVPDGSEAARRDHRRPHARLRRARRVGDADVLHQRQEARRRADGGEVRRDDHAAAGQKLRHSGQDRRSHRIAAASDLARGMRGQHIDEHDGADSR